MLLAINTQGEEGKDGGGGGGMNPVMKRHLELEIKTLQNAPRDADKLERLLTVKERQKEEAMHLEDTQKLVTEIEMLRIVLYLVNMNRNITPQRQDRKMRRNS